MMKADEDETTCRRNWCSTTTKSWYEVAATPEGSGVWSAKNVGNSLGHAKDLDGRERSIELTSALVASFNKCVLHT